MDFQPAFESLAGVGFDREISSLADFRSARCKSSAPTDILISMIEMVRDAAIMTKLSENMI